MMITSRLLLSLMLVPMVAMPSGAQRLAPLALRSSDGTPAGIAAPLGAALEARRDTAPEPVREPSVARTLIGGVVGGVVGTYVGLMVGANAAKGCHGDMCGVGEALLGVLIGEPLGLAIGAHIGSGSRQHERVLLTSLASAGILVGGVAAGVGMSHIGTEATGSIMIPLTPVLQLVTAVAIEAH